jgi:hypothetical protein
MVSMHPWFLSIHGSYANESLRPSCLQGGLRTYLHLLARRSQLILRWQIMTFLLSHPADHEQFVQPELQIEIAKSDRAW